MSSGLQMALCLAVVVLLLTARASAVHGRGHSETRSEKEATIVGGTNATIEEFPCQVQLKVSDTFCGGSVLSERWVLTAAHCCSLSENPVVRSSTSTMGRGGLTHTVKRQIIHERFVHGAEISDYDIAVLEMKKPFVWTKQLQPVRGLATEDPPAGSRVVVSGWGDLYHEGPSASQLQQVAMSIVDWQECRRKYETAGSGLVTKTKICSIEEGKGDCHNDSGGAVIDEKTRVQVGIVSGGGPCASEYPNVYSSVAKLRGWIREKTGTQGELATTTETTPPFIEWLPL